MNDLELEEREAAYRIYDMAQQSAEHHDTILWEATYIIWGSTTLLLGFVLEAIRQEPFLSLITACLSIFITIMVQFLTLSFRRVRNKKYAICKDIEVALDLKWKQHKGLDTPKFPTKVQTIWYICTTIIFVIVWTCVAVRSIYLLRY